MRGKGKRGKRRKGLNPRLKEVCGKEVCGGVVQEQGERKKKGNQEKVKLFEESKL
jgi:hypothetical protein